MWGRLRLKCDDTRAETRFRLSAKRTSPFKSAGTSVQSTAGSRGVRISGSNAEYTMFRGSVKSTGYPLHSPFSPSLSFPCVTVSHHTSSGLYSACSDFWHVMYIFLHFILIASLNECEFTKWLPCCFTKHDHKRLLHTIFLIASWQFM
jgi:hypothetical protein